ncbi:MAG: 3-hydroxyacyl-CoA dehydrogenase NAD-binding domain-containing protein [Planctomycetota bacterium]|jgi:3-hydroxyacyl-CoA dehydrogenase|nr:3-hydroxyacyl-CoA dehydrogenase NAD-binding domain-containing protein [Planctomycetota bacterium]MDP6763153.1 3-hydroxyacyl-CoA dehydrogenase NAD-binding domain-containing protein [Planctomycetota bacterium]MDP6989863.1 3-hydroxyacyl-CoA dehydrogenase NAD-binding domain-containing protein [Planctomycetota bacterium]
MSIQKVGVVGCGLMGHGIAQVAAQGGCDVVVVETDQGFLDKGMARIHKSVNKLAEKAVEKGKATEEQAQAGAAATLGRISGSLDKSALFDCDLVVEAIIEDLDIKKSLFAELGEGCKPETIFASNTSSFPVGEMAAASGRPERFVGLHFFNPVQLMRLVEVVRCEQTDDEVFAAAKAFGEACGKTAVSCKDTPGFVVNRLLIPYMTQALRMLERGDATKEDIDAAMQLGCGYPMGPLTLTDYVGLDTTLLILEGWRERYPDEPAFDVPELLAQKVAEGKLGRKTGEGFYTWEGDKRC